MGLVSLLRVFRKKAFPASFRAELQLKPSAPNEAKLAATVGASLPTHLEATICKLGGATYRHAAQHPVRV
jgi:hypothetical protein